LRLAFPTTNQRVRKDKGTHRDWQLFRVVHPQQTLADTLAPFYWAELNCLPSPSFGKYGGRRHAFSGEKTPLPLLLHIFETIENIISLLLSI